jgi:hypothetical protein
LFDLIKEVDTQLHSYEMQKTYPMHWFALYSKTA